PAVLALTDRSSEQPGATQRYGEAVGAGSHENSAAWPRLPELLPTNSACAVRLSGRILVVLIDLAVRVRGNHASWVSGAEVAALCGTFALVSSGCIGDAPIAPEEGPCDSCADGGPAGSSDATNEMSRDARGADGAGSGDAFDAGESGNDAAESGEESD